MIYETANGNIKNVKLLKWFGWITKNRIRKDYNRQREFPCTNIYPNSEKWEEEMTQWIKNNKE